MEAMMAEATETKPGSETPAPGDAGQGKTSQDTAGKPKVDADAGSRAAGGEGGQKSPDIAVGLRKELFELRESRRQTRAENEALKAKLKALEEKPPGVAENGAGTSVNFLDAPEKFMDDRDKRLLQEFSKVLDVKFHERQRLQEEVVEAQSAKEWLQSRSHLKEDEGAVAEIRDAIVDDERLLALSKLDPRRAARVAYEEWCERKGIVPDLAMFTTDKKAAAARAGAMAPAGSSGGGPRSWTVKEAEVYLDYKLPKHEYEKRWAEVQQAMKEGRIKR